MGKDFKEEFFHEEEKIRLYDADHFISMVKQVATEMVEDDNEFIVYFTVKDDALQIYLVDEDETLYEFGLSTIALDEEDKKDEEKS